MKLEQQVTSLELSKKLRELGVKQESLFVWDWSMEEGVMADLIYWEKDKPNSHKVMGGYLFSAFTVAELGEMLPSGFEVNKYSDGEWSCQMPCSPLNRAMSEVDARAKFLISLLENKLITL